MCLCVYIHFFCSVLFYFLFFLSPFLSLHFLSFCFHIYYIFLECIFYYVIKPFNKNYFKIRTIYCSSSHHYSHAGYLPVRLFVGCLWRKVKKCNQSVIWWVILSVLFPSENRTGHLFWQHLPKGITSPTCWEIFVIL